MWLSGKLLRGYLHHKQVTASLKFRGNQIFLINKFWGNRIFYIFKFLGI